MKVRITKCSSPAYWYDSMVGEVFDVSINLTLGNIDFCVKGGKHEGRIIFKRDCEIIEENNTTMKETTLIVKVPRTKPEPEAFSIDKYNTGNYDVVTRDGRPARIICTDKKGDYPIVRLVFEENNFETVGTCDSAGNFNVGLDNSPNDILLVPRKQQEQDLPRDFYVFHYNSGRSYLYYTKENFDNARVMASHFSITHYKHEWE